jgi:integrase
LTLPTSKSGRPRYIELSSVVVETLQRVPRHLGEPIVFPDCRKVSHHFPAWVTEAKLPGKVTLHTLRHTFASRLVMAGVDLLTVRELGGWGRKAAWRWWSGTRMSQPATSGRQSRPWPEVTACNGVALRVAPGNLRRSGLQR